MTRRVVAALALALGLVVAGVAVAVAAYDEAPAAAPAPARPIAPPEPVLTPQPVDLTGATDAAHGPRWLRSGRTELRLACDAAPLLEPGERRRYAMRATVPGQAVGGAVLLTWGFVDDIAEGPAQEWVDLIPTP